MANKWCVFIVTVLSSAVVAAKNTEVIRSTEASGSGSYRKDFYLAQFKEYPSTNSYPEPTDGGRVHITITNYTCGDVTSVKINGQEGTSLPSDDDDLDFTYYDWFRVHKDGKIVWISFHSRNTKWLSDDDSLSVLDVDVSGSDDCKFSGQISVSARIPTTVTYVTTRGGGKEIVVHIHNSGKDGDTLKSLFVNGENVEIGKRASVEAHQTNVFVVKTAKALTPGSIWSVSLRSSLNGDDLTSSWGGRVIPEYFPVLVWPKSDDCPIVGVNDDTSSTILSLGVNSVFADSTKCGDLASIADKLASDNAPMRLSLKSKYVDNVQNRSAIAAVFIGDEVDGQMDKNLRNTDPAMSNQKFPELPTYQGAKTNRHIGAYSGITDIQGMDAYVAACAPTIVNVLKPLPLSYPYEYLKNTRMNHMPLPTWLYSQLYSDAWSYQADAPELAAQMVMTVLAGAKGVTLFQSYQDEFKKHDTKTLKTILRTIAALGELFRTGDVDGAVVTDSGEKTMTTAVRTPEKLVVVVLNMDASGYSNLVCHTFVDKHWTFHSQTVKSVQLELPSGITLTNPVEQVEDSRIGVKDADVKISGNSVVLSNVKLDDKVVGRFFVFDVSEDADEA